MLWSQGSEWRSEQGAPSDTHLLSETQGTSVLSWHSTSKSDEEPGCCVPWADDRHVGQNGCHQWVPSDAHVHIKCLCIFGVCSLLFVWSHAYLVHHEYLVPAYLRTIRYLCFSPFLCMFHIHVLLTTYLYLIPPMNSVSDKLFAC